MAEKTTSCCSPSGKSAAGRLRESAGLSRHARRDTIPRSRAPTRRLRPFQKMTDPGPILDLIEAFRRSKTMFAAVALGIFDGERPQGAALDRLLEACASWACSNSAAINSSTRRLPTSICAAPARDAFRLHPVFEHRAVSAMGPSGGRGPRRHPPVEANVRPGRRHLFTLLQNRGSEARFSDGHARLRHAQFAPDRRRLRSLALSPLRGSGGATGHLALAAKDRYPHLNAALFDLPEVIEVARSLWALRSELIAGDFFTDELPPADLYALGRILHDWNEEKISNLLPRIHTPYPRAADC